MMEEITKEPVKSYGMKYLDFCTKQNKNKNEYLMDFRGGAVVENPLASAGDMGLSRGPGRSHMPWSN